MFCECKIDGQRRLNKQVRFHKVLAFSATHPNHSPEFVWDGKGLCVPIESGQLIEIGSLKFKNYPDRMVFHRNNWAIARVHAYDFVEVTLAENYKIKIGHWNVRGSRLDFYEDSKIKCGQTYMDQMAPIAPGKTERVNKGTTLFIDRNGYVTGTGKYCPDKL